MVSGGKKGSVGEDWRQQSHAEGRAAGLLLSGQRCGQSSGSLTLGRLGSNPMSQVETVPGGGGATLL